MLRADQITRKRTEDDEKKEQQLTTAVGTMQQEVDSNRVQRRESEKRVSTQ